MDSFIHSNSATAASNNGGTLASETDADVNKLTLYGSAFLSRNCAAAEDHPPTAKAAKLSSSAYHTPPRAFPFLRSSSGYGGGGVNGTSLCGVKGPFTASQWMELEHQALIYKYITVNVPIPSSLLIPIRKAFESSGFSCFSFLKPNALGWGGFHLGLSQNDLEPGRCRRTDGKKWRCSRDALTDQKYCERHMNRGRHRSRKPVEGGATTTPSTSPPVSLLHHHQETNNHSTGNRCPTEKESSADPKICFKNNQHNAFTQSEFGSVCSDSLLNPFNGNSSHALRHFIDKWPKSYSDLRSCTESPNIEKLSASPPPSLFREFEPTEMGLRNGSVHYKQSQRHSSWVPISWEPSVGGPLGEALHNKELNLMETRLPSSPSSVHRGDLIGISPGTESSKMPPSLPAL